MIRACHTCDFFAVIREQGQCRHGAPQLVVLPIQPSGLVGAGQQSLPSTLGTWPPTGPGSWCGQWKQRCHSPQHDGAMLQTAEAPEEEQKS